MRPIQDIADLREGHVLYHSAFGFARVDEIGEADVRVEWEAADRNLPRVVSRDTLRRVYSLCRPGGFFERALLAPDPLRELLQVDPLTAMEMLLEDLAGPQSPTDLREWLIALDLLNEHAFDRWWDGVEPRMLRDGRFRELKGLLSLKVNRGDGSPVRQLDDPMLPPGRRLDLALELRDRLGEDAFRHHVVTAWRGGGSSQVRELALHALQGHHPQRVLMEMLTPGPDNAEALIHAVRRAGWTPQSFDEEVLGELLDRVRRGPEDPTLLDTEGRLAAAVARWWPDGTEPLLVDLATGPRGQPLVRAALEALPPSRAEAVHVSLLDRALTMRRLPAAGWLTWLLLDGADESPKHVGQRLMGNHPRVARWILDRFAGEALADMEDVEEDIAVVTMEVELEPLGEEEMMPLGDLPARTGRTIVTLACSLARALAEAHGRGRIVSPTGRSFVLHLDGSVELHADYGDPESSPRPQGEPPSLRADVYASAVLILETMLGRIWPRNLPTDRVLPYLRHVVPDLPPSAIAPLDAALHPDAQCRPADGREWLALWESVSRAEAARSVSNPSVPRPLALGYDTHIGHMKILHTQTNQDSLTIGSRGSTHLLCVCDGISTANAGSGDVASGITTHVVASLFEQNLSRLQDADDFSAEAFVERALGMANRAVCEAAMRFAGGDLSGRVPMGTTVVVALIRGSRVQLGWLGDSRAYLVGRYGAALLTADMNQAGERLKAWHRGDELVWDPAGFALVGYIGHFNEDFRPEALVPRQVSFTLLPGERLVMCSDGVSDYVSVHHPGVAQVVRECTWEQDPADAAPALVAEANRGGGGDNCTAIVAALLPRGDDETEELHGL